MVAAVTFQGGRGGQAARVRVPRRRPALRSGPVRCIHIYIYIDMHIYIYMYMYVAYASRILQRPVTTRGSPANGWAAWRSVRGARGSLSGAVGVLGGCPGVLRSFLGISRVSGLVLGRSLGALRGLWGVPGGAWAFLGGPCLSVVSWSCLRHALRKPVR